MDEKYDAEKEGRVNALRQLLDNSQKDVLKAFEGDMPPDEYQALKDQRQAWKQELAELQGEQPEQMYANEVSDGLLERISRLETVQDMMLGIEVGEDKLQAARQFATRIESAERSVALDLDGNAKK